MMTSGYEFSVQLHCQGFFQLKLVEESNDRFPIAPGVGTRTVINSLFRKYVVCHVIRDFSLINPGAQARTIAGGGILFQSVRRCGTLYSQADVLIHCCCSKREFICFATFSACGCDCNGSSNLQCADSTGLCVCKSGYSGTTTCNT